MQRITAILAVLVLLLTVFGLCGCDGDEPVATLPTVDSTIPETGPAPTLSASQRYTKAVREVQNARNLVLNYTSTQTRVVAGETFSAQTAGTASYANIHTAEAQALIQEELTYGTYRNTYYQSYMGGQAYSRLNNSNFVSELTLQEFLAQQLPTILLNKDLYGSMEEVFGTDGNLSLRFEEPAVLEQWVGVGENATVTTAYGVATLNNAGSLVSYTYHAEYTVGVAQYTLDVAVNLQIPQTLDLNGRHPVYPETCATLADLRIPKYLLQTVGDLFSAQAMTAEYTDTVHSQAFNQLRSQTKHTNTYGTGENFIAAIKSQVTVKDFSGIPTVNTQNVQFLNGVYSYSINGADPVPDTTVTAETVRTMCEDSILGGLMTLDAITGAEILDTGDFLCITFTGSENFAETICTGIYSLFGMDLDIWASSYTTDAVGGYLTINKQTGLATAMGLNMKRTHIIDSVPYALTYQVDQSLTLPSLTAYENITGTPANGNASTEPVAPLFYKITDAEGHVMWLLGTLGIGDSRSNCLPTEILNALSAADAMAVSYDPDLFRQQVSSDSLVSGQLADAYYYSKGETTQAHLPAQLYDLAYPLILVSGQNSINVPYMKAILWEDIILELYLRQSYSLSIQESIDNRLLNLAAAQSKPVYEIESGLTHLQLATHLSNALQTGILQNRIQTGQAGSIAQNEALYDAWCRGDEEALLRQLTVDDSQMSEDEKLLLAEYRTIMHTKHNKGLLKAAKGYLSSGETIFYAVDVAHLLGSDGLVAALQNAGLTVERVAYGN